MLKDKILRMNSGNDAEYDICKYMSVYIYITLYQSSYICLDTHLCISRQYQHYSGEIAKTWEPFLSLK